MTNDLEVELALAGFDKRRPMKAGTVWAHTVVAVEGDYLVYRIGQRTKHNSSSSLLRSFLETRESREAAIRFCKRWGVLRLCRHGLPATHGACSADPPFRSEIVKGSKVSYCRESVEAVQAFAAALASLLRIGAEMSLDRPGRVEDWRVAIQIISEPDFENGWGSDPWSHGVGVARGFLQILIHRLIEICEVRPRFHWSDKASSWQIDLDARTGVLSNLPALLIIELIVTIADRDGFAICSSCHKAYIPARRPDPTRRNYCSTCGISAAQRDAAREYRKRTREARTHNV
jgi:hypothetical protein